MADMSSIDNATLISLVENKPVLWDKTSEFYKNRSSTQMAWREIMMDMNPEAEAWDEVTRQNCVRLIMQRWTHIRDNYYRSYKKIQNQKRTANKYTRITKPYLYSKKLKFLQKVMPPNDTVGSDTIANVKSESQDSSTLEEISITDTEVMITTNTTQEPIPARVVYNDPQPEETVQEPPNRHLLFFKGILPSLENFDDNETLDFQMGVLKVLKKIKNSRQSQQLQTFNVKLEETSSNHSGYSS